MQLREFLAEEKLTLAAFCGRLARVDGGVIVKPQVVHRYTLPAAHRDFTIPRRPIALAIYRATAGAVTPNDLYQLPDLDPAPAEIPEAIPDLPRAMDAAA